jgi:hypothetical protein
MTVKRKSCRRTKASPPILGAFTARDQNPSFPCLNITPGYSPTQRASIPKAIGDTFLSHCMNHGGGCDKSTPDGLMTPTASKHNLMLDLTVNGNDTSSYRSSRRPRLGSQRLLPKIHFVGRGYLGDIPEKRQPRSYPQKLVQVCSMESSGR